MWGKSREKYFHSNREVIEIGIKVCCEIQEKGNELKKIDPSYVRSLLEKKVDSKQSPITQKEERLSDVAYAALQRMIASDKNINAEKCANVLFDNLFILKAKKRSGAISKWKEFLYERVYYFIY